MSTFIDSTYMKIVAFKVISSGCNALVPFQQLLEGPMDVLLCERVNDLRHSLLSQLYHNDSLWAWGITKSHREQGLDYTEGDKLSWCPSWSNSLWQGWSCGLVYCPGGNATVPFWRVLAALWTPLKPQHSNPNPLANQLWCIDFLTPPTYHHPSLTPCLPWISYATQKLMLDSCKMVEKQSEAFHTFLWHFFF